VYDYLSPFLPTLLGTQQLTRPQVHSRLERGLPRAQSGWPWLAHGVACSSPRLGGAVRLQAHPPTRANRLPP
jgi:hypothetical protein